MVLQLSRRRHPHFRGVLCFLLFIMSMSSVARSQDTEQQLQQLKEQLEITTRQNHGNGHHTGGRQHFELGRKGCFNCNAVLRPAA
jgi:hypothetical protein